MYSRGLGDASAVLDAPNRAGAALLYPISGQLQLLTLPPASLPPALVQEFEDRPVDVLLELLRPAEDFLADVAMRAGHYVWQDTGKTRVRISPAFARVVEWDMRVDGVPEDQALDPTARAFVRRLRIIGCWLTHVMHHPARLGQAFADICARDGRQDIAWLGGALAGAAAAMRSGGVPGMLHFLGTTARNVIFSQFLGLGEAVTGAAATSAASGTGGTIFGFSSTTVCTAITCGTTVVTGLTTVIGGIVVKRTPSAPAQPSAAPPGQVAPQTSKSPAPTSGSGMSVSPMVLGLLLLVGVAALRR